MKPAPSPARRRSRTPRPAPDALPVLGTTLDFMRLMWHLDHELQLASKRMERALGVTGPQRLIVRILARFPELPAGQLSSLLCIHPSTLTGILQRLQRLRLLRRRRDPNDRRRTLLSLTAKGRAIDALREGTIEFAVQRALSSLPPAKVRAARALLLAIAQMLAHEAA